MFVDPDGRYLESVWDIASLITGVVSFKSNIQQGNIGDAVVDGLSIVADGISLALPGIPGGFGAGIKGARVAGKAVDGIKAIDKGAEVVKVVEKTAETSRAARRKVMRDAGIPTSQQSKSQTKNSSGREYSYDTPKEGGGVTTKSVQQQTKDRSHKEQPHWEAGEVKTDQWGNILRNRFDRPKLYNNKSKINY